MKRVQDYLRQLDRVKLIQEYFKYAPNGNKGLFDSKRYEGPRGEYLRCRDLDEFIQRMIDMKMSDIPDGRTHILCAYPDVPVSNWNKDVHTSNVRHSLYCKEEVLELGEFTHWERYDTSSHSEIVGLYVADTPYTQERIYELMAQVLYGALCYGFEQERMAEANPEFEEPLGAWYKNPEEYYIALEEREEVCNDDEAFLCNGEEDSTQLGYWVEVLRTLIDYKVYCSQRELLALQKSLLS